MKTERLEEVGKRFSKDVANHAMTIYRDDELYRHVRFSNPKCSGYWFDLVTWPGYLCVSGDMGDYVFSSIPDMFAFFRQPQPNPSYWAEKCEAADWRGGLEEYSPAAFRRGVFGELRDCCASNKVRQQVRDLVLSRADDGREIAVGAAMDFECDGFQFSDFHKVCVTEYTHSFLWICHALPWAIAQYDAAKVANAQDTGVIA